MKEIIISILIVGIIISFDIFTQGYTVKTVEDITKILETIKEDLQNINIDKENLNKNCKKLKENWDEKQNKMAYYIEHDELEKVNTNITSMLSYIETSEYNLALEQIETNIFILDHIKDKYQLSLENIF